MAVRHQHKTRSVSVAALRRDGDAVQRMWALSRSQEERVLAFLRDALGEPDADAIIPAEAVAAAMDAAHDKGAVIMEAPPDLEADADAKLMAAETRSISVSPLPSGDVLVGVIYGTMPEAVPGETRVKVPMVRDGSVVIKRDQFDAFLAGIAQWWEKERRK